MPVELVELKRGDIEALPKSRTVFFFPLGPVEDHGPALPVGLDLGEAHALCRLTAERMENDLPGWVGVLMPTAPLGIDSDTTEFAITVRGHVLRDWLVDACRSLNRFGFEHFVAYSGHLGPKQLTAIEEASQTLAWRGIAGRVRALLPSAKNRPRPRLVSASSAAVSPATVKKSPLWPDPEEHGGKRDTSVALALGVLAAPPSGLPARPRPAETFLSRFFLRLEHRTAGYWGDPSGASAEDGQRALTDGVDAAYAKLRAVWEGANPNQICRSWYSVIPPNRSFFAAWVLSFGIIFLMVAWLWIGFEVGG